MIGLSKLRTLPTVTTKLIQVSSKNSVQQVGRRNMSKAIMHDTPSTWQWEKFKDLFHFYTIVGLAPWVVIITYLNLRYGDAKLVATPDDYEPEDWECERHPLSQFIVRHSYKSYQQQYEEELARAYNLQHSMVLNETESKVKSLIRQRQDVKAWVFTHYPSFFNESAHYAHNVERYRTYGLKDIGDDTS